MCRQGLDRQVLLIEGPAGFGKSELLKAAHASYLGDARVHVGWLTLSAAHADRTLFARELAEALGVAAPAGDDVQVMLDRVAARGRRTLLLLDSLDAAAPSAMDGGLDILFRDPPDLLSIACASRQRTAIPVSRLRLRGLVSEIGPDRLAFTRSEIRRLLGNGTSAVDVEAAVALSRGWPAVAKLIADESSANGKLHAGQNIPASVGAYIDEVVLSQLCGDTRLALEACSIAAEFPLELARVLAAGPCDAEAIAGGVIAPVIEESRPRAGWYRFHPAARAHLAGRLMLRGGAHVEMLHRRAAAWFAEHGCLEEAVSHAASGGDYAFAARAITGAGGVNLFIQVGHTLLVRLIEYLPTDAIYQSPNLSLCYALVLAKRGRLAAARELADELKNENKVPDPSRELIPEATLGHIDSLIAIYQDSQLDRDRIDSLERTARRLGPREKWERGWLYNHLCIAYTRSGDLEQARISALKALECYQEKQAAYAQIFMLTHLGLIHTLLGSFSASLTFSREARDMIQTTQWSDRNLFAIAQIPLAEILYCQGETADAERMLSEAVNPICRGEGWVDLYTRMFSILARARLRIIGVDAAINAIDRAEQVAVERGLSRLKLAVEIMRVEIFTRAGMLESAEHAASAILTPSWECDRHSTWTWRERNDFLLARARLRLAESRAAEALVDIERLLVNAGNNGGGYYKLFGAILATPAAWSAGQHSYALRSLQAAIALARPHEVIQPFLDEGAPMIATVRAIVRRFGLRRFSSDAVEFISRLSGSTAAAPYPNRRSRAASRAGIILSRRETEVLAHLSEGNSNKEIARALGMSEATVKFHLKNIFAKLGVSRRSVAVSVASRLGLLAGT